MLVDFAAASGTALPLGEGAAREERNRQFAALKKRKGAVPDKWADSDIQTIMMQEAQERFDKFFGVAYQKAIKSSSTTSS